MVDAVKLDATPDKDEDTLPVHPAIELLVARMKSNPKEFFKFDPNRSGVPTYPNPMLTQISTQIDHTKALWNRKEKRLFNMALREARLEELHLRLMYILLTK